MNKWIFFPTKPISSNGEYQLKIPPEFQFLLEYYEFPKNYSATPNFHDFFEIAIVYAGSGIYKTTSKEYKISTNDIFIVSASKMHSVKTTYENLKIICIIFFPEFIFSVFNAQNKAELLIPFYLDEKKINHTILKNNKINKHLHEQFERIQNCIQSNSKVLQHRIQGELIILLSLILENYYVDIFEKIANKKDRHLYKKLQEAFHYIHSHYHQSI